MAHKLVLVLVFILASSATAYAQKVVAVAGEDESFAMLTITDPLFDGMCQSLAKRLGVPRGAEVLIFEPKLTGLRPGQAIGDIWNVSYKEKALQVRFDSLPAKFGTLRGPIAEKVLNMTCYLGNQEYYSKQDMTITADNIADVLTLAKVFR